MKKVIIVLLLVVVVVLSMTGCRNVPFEVVEGAPAKVTETGRLQFEKIGTYNIPKPENECVVYRFAAPNDKIVVYEMPGDIYWVGEAAERHGNKYVSMYIQDSEFVALSNEYVLLVIGEEMVAVSINGCDNNSGCTGLVTETSFHELSEAEKDAFVYPC